MPGSVVGSINLYWRSLRHLFTVKPPLVDNLNKGHLPLSGQHDMHGLNFSIQINLPTKDTSIWTTRSAPMCLLLRGFTVQLYSLRIYGRKKPFDWWLARNTAFLWHKQWTNGSTFSRVSNSKIPSRSYYTHKDRTKCITLLYTVIWEIFMCENFVLKYFRGQPWPTKIFEQRKNYMHRIFL